MKSDRERPQTKSARYGDIEVRAPCGELDEIVGKGTLHLEQMNDGCWWFSFTDENGYTIHCNLWGTGEQIGDRDDVMHEVVGRVEYQGQVVAAPPGSKHPWKIIPPAEMPDATSCRAGVFHP